MNWVNHSRKGWVVPESSGDPESGEGAYGDFNASLTEQTEGGTTLVKHAICDADEDAADVREARRRLADPKDGTISIEDLRGELGI